MGTTEAADREAVRRRLLHDHEFYAANALTIVDKQGNVVPFVYKEPQRRFARMLEAQRDAGQPMRGVALKARQIGVSTEAQGMLIQRATQLAFHNALVVAHSGKTVGALHKMGKGMAQRLPAQIRPTIAYENNSQGRQYVHWGEPSRQLRAQGVTGLDSSYTVATAKEAQDGRGLTYRTVHFSEMAFYKKEGKDGAAGGEAMFLGVAQAVPDDPESMILGESTANGENWFKDFWDAAVAGENGYAAFFTAWFEEPAYRRPFANEQDRLAFAAEVGLGPYGADEPELKPLIAAYWIEEGVAVEDIDRIVLEYLHWRRWAIGQKTLKSVEKFHQEYPSTPEEAFLSTGRKAFASAHVARVRKQVDVTDPVTPSLEVPGPVRGNFRAEQKRTVVGRNGARFDLPQKALWVPSSKLEATERASWKLWQAPQKKADAVDSTPARPDGQYIVAVDPMSGEDNEGALANHAIQVIDHRSRRQVAEYESQLDPDQVALDALLVALYFNRAWIAVEITGGWGWPIVRRLALDYHYARVYTRDDEESRGQHMHDRLGWSTDSRTKPQLLARGQELLREEVDGIRSRTLALQLGWYIIDERGKSGPQPGKLSDVLMAWLIAQEVASRRPVRPDRPRGAISTTGSGRIARVGAAG